MEEFNIPDVTLKPTLGGYAVYLGGVFIGRVSAARGPWSYQRTSTSAPSGNFPTKSAAVQALVREYKNELNSFMEYVESAVDEIDTIMMDIPLLIRMLEFAREEAKDDMVLHRVVDNMLEIQKSKNEALSMDDYEKIIGEQEESTIPDDLSTPRTYRDAGIMHKDARMSVED